MKTNRLSPILSKALNEQVTTEAYSAQVYLALSSWADSEGYQGVAGFLAKHAVEERIHMTKLIEYIQERGGLVEIDAIPKPKVAPKTMEDCIHAVFTQEVTNTKAIYKIVKLALDEEDWATWNHLQWFVKEQREEEKLSLQLWDKIKIAGGKNATDNALYSFDRDIAQKPQESPVSDDLNLEG